MENFGGGVSKCTFGLHPRRCVRMAKMQGAEDEGAGSVLKYMTKPESDSNEADWLLWHTASNIFHTQGDISVLTLLAFDDEMYYICIEIWEEPRLLLFFRHFPFKIGDLEAHPGKIRGRQRKIRGRQRKIWGRQRKTMRQIGKIGRRKVFSEVKNVNVKSLKNDSKLLVFGSGSLPPTPP